MYICVCGIENKILFIFIIAFGGGGGGGGGVGRRKFKKNFRLLGRVSYSFLG